MKISRKSLDFIQQFTYIAQEVRTRIVGLLASFPSQEYEQRFCIVYIPRLCSRLMQGVYKIQEPLPLLTFSRSCFSQQLFKNIRKKGGNVTGLSLKLIWRFIFEVKRVLMSDVSNCFEKFWKFLIYSNRVKRCLKKYLCNIETMLFRLYVCAKIQESNGKPFMWTAFVQTKF